MSEFIARLQIEVLSAADGDRRGFGPIMIKLCIVEGSFHWPPARRQPRPRRMAFAGRADHLSAAVFETVSLGLSPWYSFRAVLLSKETARVTELTQSTFFCHLRTSGEIALSEWASAHSCRRTSRPNACPDFAVGGPAMIRVFQRL